MPRPQLIGVTPRQGASALAAGLLGAGAFWPLSLWPLLPFSIVLFLWLLRDQGTQAARNVGLIYGLAFAGGTMYWMFWIFGAMAVPLLAIMAAYFGLLAMLVALTRGTPGPARAALVALFAVAIEWLRGETALTDYQKIALILGAVATSTDTVVFTWFSLRLNRLAHEFVPAQ